MLHGYRSQLKMRILSTLYLHLPARSLAQSAEISLNLRELTCAYALYKKPHILARAGRATLQELSALIQNSKNVVLIVAAADVIILRAAVPPLSSAKLRAALPNLIEDKLLTDAVENVMVCSSGGNIRSVAVMQRGWLLELILILRELGAQLVSALPEQLCLPYSPGKTSVFISEHPNGIALAIRTSADEGMGILQNSPEASLQTLHALLPGQDIDLFVASDSLSAYQALLAGDAHIQVGADDTSRWQLSTLDLAAGLGASAQADWNWQPWKWPLALATLLLISNTLALNLDWWNMGREAANLRASMKQIYVSAFPKETVILDPLLQMQQKISAAQRDNGLGASDDFANLAAEFGQAWLSVLPAANSAISGIEYHEHSLLVRFKSEVSATAMQTALATRNLALESGANFTWQIRSKK